MTLIRRQVNYVSGLIIRPTAFAGVLAFAALPEQVAIHFSAFGTPDNFLPRTVGVALLPAIMLVTFLYLRYTHTVDPTADSAVLRVTSVAIVALLDAIHAIVLAWNLDYPADRDLVFPGVIVWTILHVGYAFSKDGV